MNTLEKILDKFFLLFGINVAEELHKHHHHHRLTHEQKKEEARLRKLKEDREHAVGVGLLVLASALFVVAVYFLIQFLQQHAAEMKV